MKNVLITGASRGVGFALASKFLREGFSVFCASRHLDSLKQVEEKYPNSCFLVELDLENEQSIRQAVEKIEANSNKLDIVVHNAGALVNKPFQNISLIELQRCYAVNVLGPYQLTQDLLPTLAPDAHVVTISSMGGFQGTQKFAGLTAYSSSKAAAASLTECLQEEFKETNWSFNCLCLGAVQTEMLEEAFPGYVAPTTSAQMAHYIFNFAMNNKGVIKGKVLPLSSTNP